MGYWNISACQRKISYKGAMGRMDINVEIINDFLAWQAAVPGRKVEIKIAHRAQYLGNHVEGGITQWDYSNYALHVVDEKGIVQFVRTVADILPSEVAAQKNLEREIERLKKLLEPKQDEEVSA